MSADLSAVEAMMGSDPVSAHAGEAPDPRLQSAEIIDELMSTLMAAQEPPSIALTWILDHLIRHRSAAARLVAYPESTAVRRVSREHSGDAAVKEVLRLNPPASGVLRRLTEPMPVGQVGHSGEHRSLLVTAAGVRE